MMKPALLGIKARTDFDEYGGARPIRKVGGISSSASAASSSAISRDLPTPGWPMIVTRCGRRSAVARS